jgi:flagellar assembly protein FliH
MSAPAKFLFDIDFGAGRGKQADHVMSSAAVAAAVAEAEARGYRTGRDAARAEAIMEAERLAAAALDRIGNALEQLVCGLRAVEGRLEAEAVEVAAAVATKLAPELIAREPFAELAALAAECFKHLVGAPHVVVRVNDALHAQARDRLAEIARAQGFEGRLVVLAEPDIAPGDCRIEWADGGLSRDRARTEAVIAEAVDRYLLVRRAGAPASVPGMAASGGFADE